MHRISDEIAGVLWRRQNWNVFRMSVTNCVDSRMSLKCLRLGILNFVQCVKLGSTITLAPASTRARNLSGRIRSAHALSPALFSDQSQAWIFCRTARQHSTARKRSTINRVASLWLVRLNNLSFLAYLLLELRITHYIHLNQMTFFMFASIKWQ